MLTDYKRTPRVGTWMGIPCVHIYIYIYAMSGNAYVHAYMHTCIYAYMHTCIHASQGILVHDLEGSGFRK